MSLDFTRLRQALAVASGDAGCCALQRRIEALLVEVGASGPLAQGFVDHLADRVPAGLGPSSSLADWRIEDLWLCYASLRGDPGAVQSLRSQHRPTLEAALRRLHLSPSLHLEALQGLEALLLAGDGEHPPLLAQYAGIGRLGAWLRVVAARRGGRLLDQEKRLLPLDDEHLADKLGGSGSPELSHLKRAYQGVFRQAFKEAIRQLSPRELNVLRHRYLDGLTVSAIGVIYRVHHSTVSRWIAAACEQVLEQTRQRMRAALDLSPEECESLLGLLRSQLDLTLSLFFERSRRGAAGDQP